MDRFSTRHQGDIQREPDAIAKPRPNFVRSHCEGCARDEVQSRNGMEVKER